MERGIQGSPSSLQMENTYIPELPDGTGKIEKNNNAQMAITYHKP